MSAPLTPPDCDLTDFQRMMIDIPRLRGSDFDATQSDGAWRAGLNLWLSSWHQVPAGSLSDDEATLTKAAGLGRDIRTWRRVKAEALRNWIKCDDGLLYHPVVAELALEAWLEKLAQALSSGAGNAKRWKTTTFDPAPIEADIDRTAEMLRALNPKSKALTKLERRRSRPSSEVDPDGSGKPNRRDAENVPSGSQGTGTGKGYSSEDKSSAKLSSMADPDATAWSTVRLLLSERCGLTDQQSGAFFGKLLSTHNLQARHMLPSVAQAVVNGTGDPRGYLTAAAAGVAKGRADPRESASEKAVRSNIQ